MDYQLRRALTILLKERKIAIIQGIITFYIKVDTQTLQTKVLYHLNHPLKCNISQNTLIKVKIEHDSSEIYFLYR
jgi:hypothetical protein